MKRTVGVLSVLMLTCASAFSQEKPLDAARGLLVTGDYAKAREVLEKIVADAPADAAAAELLMQLDMELGHYNAARVRGEAFLKVEPKNVPVRAAYAWAFYGLGLRGDAYREAQRVRIFDRDNLDAQLLRGLIQQDRGENSVARSTFETFVDFWLACDEKKLSAADVVLVGRGCTRFAVADRNAKMLGEIVNMIYPLALRKDPRCTAAMVASGMLFLEKFNVAQADKEFQAALKVNPNHPEALIGLARCELARRDFEDVYSHLEAARKVAPDHPDVILLDALLSLYDQDYDTALKRVAQALRVNPTDQEGLGIMAAAIQLMGNAKDYAVIEREALSLNPKCAEFYVTVAAALTRRHRDVEAEPLLRKALALAPGDGTAPAHLGLLLMRHGKEDEAYKVLEDAHEKDGFNVLVYNTLELLDKMKGFAEVRSEHFTIKIHPGADQVLAEYASDYLESIRPELVKRYRFDVPNTLIEIFPNHRMFSVRTTGVPNVGTVGACLGPMVVMDSPLVMRRPGAFNWADVLRHEYTHVVTLTATKNRISHWFTEALAVTEQEYPRPYAWHQMLVDATVRGELMPVTKLSHGFTRARNPRTRQLAYAQSHLVAMFVKQKWGDEKLADMLVAYRDGKTCGPVIETVFEMKPEAFDAAFAGWMKDYTATLALTPGPVTRDLDEVDRLIEAAPDDASLHVERARIKLAKHDLTGAALDVNKAIELEPANPRAQVVLGALRLAQGNVEEAEKAFLKAQALDPKDFDVDRGLLAVYQANKNDALVLTYLQKLEKHEPMNPGYPRALADLYEKQKNMPAAVEAWRKAAACDGQDYASRRKLVAFFVDNKQYKDAARYVDEAIHIWPYERQIHEWGETAFKALGDDKRAEREKKMAALCPGPRTREGR